MLKLICDGCKKEEDGFDSHKCEECIEKEIIKEIASLEEDYTTETVLCVKAVIENESIWTDKETYKDFEFKKDEDMFKRGLKIGYAHALFVMCSYFGLEDKYSDNIEKIQWEK